MSDIGRMPGSDPLYARPRSLVSTLAIWIVIAAILLILPQVFNSGLSITTMCLMGVTIIFALSYNMLLGQTGLLSFGHAVFFGLGGFLTAHALNTARLTHAPLPLEVFPLVGGAAGLVFGIIFGAVSTRRSGTAFAMITLGIGELVSSSALILRHAFGGEEGISVDRTQVLHLFGITFGPQTQVYYLIAGWGLVSAGAMYALTRTPFGRICNAVRDNPDRAAFIGYNTTTVRFIAFSLAGLFAGIAGGLAAVNFEIATSSSLGATQSGTVVLMTFIGGVGNFAGPIIGAILVTSMQLTLSDLTSVWQLYFGLFFIAIVMYAPSGIAGMVTRQIPLFRANQLQKVVPYYLMALVPGIIAFIGGSMLIEMINRIAAHAADGPEMSLYGVALNVTSPLPWIVACVLLVGGGWLFRRAVRISLNAYNEALAIAQAPSTGRSVS